MAKKNNELPRPYNERVLVRIDKRQRASKGGIILPDATQEEERRGTVVACGPVPRTEQGTRKYEELEVGTHIMFEQGWAGSQFELNGDKYAFVSYDGIVAVLS